MKNSENDKKDKVKACKAAGKTIKECIKAEQEKVKEADKAKAKAKVKIDDYKKNLFKDCMTGCSDAKDKCLTDCTATSGADAKEKGKMKLKYEKESIKGDIDTCVAGGSTKKQCLKNQFANSQNKKQVKEAIKSSL